jgi:hypothetical protein
MTVRTRLPDYGRLEKGPGQDEVFVLLCLVCNGIANSYSR